MTKKQSCTRGAVCTGCHRWKIVACKWVRLACERYFYDLVYARRVTALRPDKAERVLLFVSLLRHSKGKWDAGRRVYRARSLQQFHPLERVWLDARGRHAALPHVVGGSRPQERQKHHRSGHRLYLAFADGEPGSEVYSISTSASKAASCTRRPSAWCARTPCCANTSVFTRTT